MLVDGAAVDTPAATTREGRTVKTLRGLLRLLHFVGLAMFLGGILGHIALEQLPGAEADAATIVVLLSAQVHSTRVLMMPGLFLLIVTGVWLTVRYHGGFMRVRWLTVHQVLAVLILLNTALILGPIGAHMLEVALALRPDAFDLSALHELARQELTFGPINLILTIAAIGVAVFRPAFAQRARPIHK